MVLSWVNNKNVLDMPGTLKVVNQNKDTNDNESGTWENISKLLFKWQNITFYSFVPVCEGYVTQSKVFEV